MNKRRVKLIYNISVGTFFVLLLGFSIVEVFEKNTEFIYYSLIISLLAAFILINQKRLHLSPMLAAAMAMHGTLHILGGNIYPDGARLYDTWLIKNVFRWDNLVHLWGSMVWCLVTYSLLPPMVRQWGKQSKRFILISLYLMTMGLGALMELIELGGVVFLDAPGVGDYLNNATDLFFNSAGAIIGCLLIFIYRISKTDDDLSHEKGK